MNRLLRILLPALMTAAVVPLFFASSASASIGVGGITASQSISPIAPGQSMTETIKVTTNSGTTYPYIGTNSISFTSAPAGVAFGTVSGTVSSCEESNGTAVTFTVPVTTTSSTPPGNDSFTISVNPYKSGCLLRAERMALHQYGYVN